MDEQSATMSVWPEAAKILGIKSKDAAYEAARRGEIPCIRIGRLLRVPRVALERLLQNPPGCQMPAKPIK